MNIKILSVLMAFSGIALLQNAASEAQEQREAGSLAAQFALPTITAEHLARVENGGTFDYAGATWRDPNAVGRRTAVRASDLKVTGQRQVGDSIAVDYLGLDGVSHTVTLRPHYGEK